MKERRKGRKERKKGVREGEGTEERKEERQWDVYWKWVWQNWFSFLSSFLNSIIILKTINPLSFHFSLLVSSYLKYIFRVNQMISQRWLRNSSVLRACVPFPSTLISPQHSTWSVIFFLVSTVFIFMVLLRFTVRNSFLVSILLLLLCRHYVNSI